MPRKSKTDNKNINKKTTQNQDLRIGIFDPKGKIKEEIKLPKEIFATELKERLLAQSIRVYLANQRQGTASTKTRREVAGSTRKIYRQKGTGRARHGDIKAPIFVGGGIAFGPKPGKTCLELPKKMKRKALFGALSAKFKKGEIIVFSGFQNLKLKTKEMVKIFKNLNLNINKGKIIEPILLVITKEETQFIPALRNLENLTFSLPNVLNPYLILKNRKIIFTQKGLESFLDLWKTANS